MNDKELKQFGIPNQLMRIIYFSPARKCNKVIYMDFPRSRTFKVMYKKSTGFTRSPHRGEEICHWPYGTVFRIFTCISACDGWPWCSGLSLDFGLFHSNFSSGTYFFGSVNAQHVCWRLHLLRFGMALALDVCVFIYINIQGNPMFYCTHAILSFIHDLSVSSGHFV